MILKPNLEDLQNIAYYLGKIILGLGLVMFIPLGIGLFFGEINPALDFIIAIEITLLSGLILTKFCFSNRDLNWMQGMVVVALAWLLAMFLGAIPLYLSGHWNSYLDSCFEAMSGFATTGLTLVQDLDHLSFSHNFWRHLMMFVGGQGIVIIALSFFVLGASGVFKLYVGEGREERILPNIVHTSRFIWLVSITYLILGTAILTFFLRLDGLNFMQALFHGMCIFMAAFDTGGFTPNSQNILYYHSFAIELVTCVIMLLGAMNFNLHYHLWTAKRKEIFQDLEMRTFFFTLIFTFLIVAFGLSQTHIYPKTMLLFRKGFYQLLSGHTGTGYSTVYAKQFIQEWNPLSLFGLIMAMSLGGAVCSTTGAIKMLRVGVIFKALKEDLKKIILPERAILAEKFHHIKEVFLEDRLVRSTLFITLAYLGLYILGALVGMFYGYPFLESLFESTSAAANVGLSCGITQVSMPSFLKIIYIIQMWMGRLEFMAIFVLVGFLIALIRGK